MFLVLAAEVANQSHNIECILEQTSSLSQEAIVNPIFEEGCFETSWFNPAQICVEIAYVPESCRLAMTRLTALVAR